MATILELKTQLAALISEMEKRCGSIGVEMSETASLAGSISSVLDQTARYEVKARIEEGIQIASDHLTNAAVALTAAKDDLLTFTANL